MHYLTHCGQVTENVCKMAVICLGPNVLNLQLPRAVYRYGRVTSKDVSYLLLKNITGYMIFENEI